MATRFAVKTGLWSDATVWDSGSVPVAGDTIYPNGFTVTIDTDVSVASLNNNISNVTIQNIATPAMTSNTQPTGTVISNNNQGTAYQAFNQDGIATTIWSGDINSGWLGYTFPTGKVIKRYIIKQQSTGQSYNPKTWEFQGSNDGFATAGVPLDVVTSYITNANYTSGLLANTTSYTSYRVIITAVFTSGNAPRIAELEMTESTTASPVYGTTAGGSFTVPSSLSGTRNIVQTGDGIRCLTGHTAGVVIVNAISGATVNFNVASGGYIFNPTWITASTNSTKGVLINGNCAVNFNGNIFGQTASGIYNDTSSGQIYINAAATVTINGNIYSPPGAAGSYTYQIHLVTSTSNAAILNINGDIISSNLSYYTYPIYLNSLATVNIVGNLTSVIGYCLFSGVGGIVNLTGTATVTNTNSSPAIYMTQQNALITSLLTINGSITNKSNVNAIIAPKIRFASTATPYWIYQTNGASDMTLSYGSAIGTFPAEADVKLGVTYAASPTRTGTCAVPLPQYVSQGVATGSTVGTAYLNAADVWNIQTSTLTTAGSIGERLKTASTVQTNGDQLASYIV